MIDEHLEFLVEAMEDRQMLSAVAGSSEASYDPNLDSNVGFNVVSFSKQRGKTARTNWANGIQSLFDNGITHVTLNVFREVKDSNGRIVGSSGTGNDVLRATMDKANELGMHVTLNPIFEVIGGDNGWRGDFDPDGADARRFQTTYRSWIRRLAVYADRFDVDRLSIGSELVAVVRQSENHEFFTSVLATADAKFDGEIGYAANWNNISNSQVADSIWDNPIVDYVGVNAYYSGADAVVDQSTANASHSNPNFVDEVTAGWNSIIDNIILPVAHAAGGGAGLPVIIQEFGAVPYNLTSVNPWSVTPGEYATGTPGETVDSDEQTALIVGLLNALDGRSDQISEVHFWTWTFEGNPSDRFGLGPGSAPESEMATDAILGFVQPSD